MDSTTLPVTFALDGSAAKLENILKWETAMKDYLLEQMGRRPDLKIAFSTDRALEVRIQSCLAVFLDRSRKSIPNKGRQILVQNVLE